MSNTEWKKGYEEGFAAGWKAAQGQNGLGYKKYPPVYYGGGVAYADGPGAYSVKPTDSISITGVGGYSVSDYAPGSFSTMADQPTPSITLNETKTAKLVRNLTDHTLIV